MSASRSTDEDPDCATQVGCRSEEPLGPWQVNLRIRWSNQQVGLRLKAGLPVQPSFSEPVHRSAAKRPPGAEKKRTSR